MSFNLENLPRLPQGFELFGYGPIPRYAQPTLSSAKNVVIGVPTTSGVYNTWLTNRVGVYPDWVYAVRIGTPEHRRLFADRSTPPTPHEF